MPSNPPSAQHIYVLSDDDELTANPFADPMSTEPGANSRASTQIPRPNSLADAYTLDSTYKPNMHRQNPPTTPTGTLIPITEDEMDLSSSSAYPQVSGRMNTNRTHNSSTSSLTLQDQNSASDPIDTYLSQKAKELTEREKALEERERALGIETTATKSNFPRFYPLFYHNLEEIPENNRRLVSLLLKAWYLLILQVVWNAFTLLFITLTGSGGITGTIGTVIAMVDIVLCPMVGLYIWYRPIYYGFQKERSIYYYLFFITFGMHILWQAWKFVGFTASGCAGLLTLLSVLTTGSLFGTIFLIISTSLWGLGCFYCVILFQRVRRHTKIQGHSMEEAKRDAVLTGATNPTARTWMFGALWNALRGNNNTDASREQERARTPRSQYMGSSSGNFV